LSLSQLVVNVTKSENNRIFKVFIFFNFRCYSTISNE
jgi:hypothetical protein